MSRVRASDRLAELASQIDFASEHYYNLYSEPEGEIRSGDLAGEAWTNLTALTADMAKLRGELYRLSRGVENLRLPAIEAVGLDRVADELRSVEARLKPVAEVVAHLKEDSRIERLLKDLLDVADALDRVIELIERQPETVSVGVQRGIRSVQELLMANFARSGLASMEVGEKFDPHQHMAMGTEENPDLADGAVSRVMLRGYHRDGKVFRSAQVVVVKNDSK
ncbi:nucleotide exchange factor GrpE [bacterium]|nr:nucleotide exchange factor GrpE [bacterium]